MLLWRAIACACSTCWWWGEPPPTPGSPPLCDAERSRPLPLCASKSTNSPTPRAAATRGSCSLSRYLCFRVSGFGFRRSSSTIHLGLLVVFVVVRFRQRSRETAAEGGARGDETRCDATAKAEGVVVGGELRGWWWWCKFRLRVDGPQRRGVSALDDAPLLETTDGIGENAGVPKARDARSIDGPIAPPAPPPPPQTTNG